MDMGGWNMRCFSNALAEEVETGECFCGLAWSFGVVCLSGSLEHFDCFALFGLRALLHLVYEAHDLRRHGRGRKRGREMVQFLCIFLTVLILTCYFFNLADIQV
jgi:hypothetical protein